MSGRVPSVVLMVGPSWGSCVPMRASNVHGTDTTSVGRELRIELKSWSNQLKPVEGLASEGGADVGGCAGYRRGPSRRLQ